jgi:hypothetical protein
MLMPVQNIINSYVKAYDSIAIIQGETEHALTLPRTILPASFALLGLAVIDINAYSDNVAKSSGAKPIIFGGEFGLEKFSEPGGGGYGCECGRIGSGARG